MMKLLETRRGVVIVTTPILLCVVLWWVFGISMIRGYGSSDAPTIRDGDVLWLSKSLSYQRGQFILLYVNSSRTTIAGTRPKYLKRLIGLPNDTISMHKGRITLNGKLLEETYTIPYWKKQNSFDDCSYLANSDYWNFQPENPLRPESPCGSTAPKDYKPKPLQLGADEYFVVGDNRSPGGSEDSRAFGVVSGADFISAVQFMGFPPKRFEIPEEFNNIK